MTSASALITEWLDVPEQYEDELNDWYRLEHLPQTLAVPGFLYGRRYRCDDAPLKHLAWYDTIDTSIETSPDLQRLRNHPSPWSERMRRLYGEHCERMNFKLMRDVGEIRQENAPWLYIVHTDIPSDVVEEYNAWYDSEHLPRLVTVPGVLRARRYTAVTTNGPRYLTAYELTDKDAFESPAGLAARKTPWTAKMRSLFHNTRRRMCELVDPR